MALEIGPIGALRLSEAKSVLGKSKKELLTAVGFTCQRLDNLTELLSAGEERTALAVLLNEDEVPEIGCWGDLITSLQYLMRLPKLIKSVCPGW